MLTADNATLHAKLIAATLADNASKATHADLNNAIAASKINARLLAQRIKKSTAYTDVIGPVVQHHRRGRFHRHDAGTAHPVCQRQSRRRGGN